MMMNRYQSNGNDHLSNCNTLETACLHVSQRVHLPFASRSFPLLYFVNYQHDFKGWGENQRIMLHDTP